MISQTRKPRSMACLVMVLAVGGLTTFAGCGSSDNQSSGAVMQDSMKSDGMMKDGIMQDSMKSDGMMKDNIKSDGMMKEGMMKDAAMPAAEMKSDKKM